MIFIFRYVINARIKKAEREVTRGRSETSGVFGYMRENEDNTLLRVKQRKRESNIL